MENNGHGNGGNNGSNLNKRFEEQDGNKKNNHGSQEGNHDPRPRDRDPKIGYGTTLSIGSYGVSSSGSVHNVSAELVNILGDAGKKEYTVLTFDAAAFNFDSSFIAIYKQNENKDKSYVYTFLLGDTGPLALTATEFNQRARDSRSQPYTKDALLDKETIDTVADEIEAETGVGTFVNSGTTVVHQKSIDVVKDMADIAVRKIEMDIEIEKKGDLNLVALFGEMSESNIEMHYHYLPDGVSDDRLGSPVKADFSIVITISPKSRSRDRDVQYNRNTGRTEIAKVFGYMDYLLEDTEDHRGNSTGLRFRPHVIITDMRIYRDTFNYGMVGLLATTIFQDENAVYNHLQYKRDEIAQLTTIINPGNEANITVPKLDTVGDEVIVELITALAVDDLKPIYSIDIENNGTLQYMMPLVDASTENDNQQVIDSLSYFTDGELKYDGDIAVSAHDLPKCLYFDKEDIDARNLTTPMIYKLSRSMDTTFEFNDATIGNTKFAFEETLNAYIASVNDCSVPSTFTRIGISEELISSLLDATNMETNITYESPDVAGIGRRRTSHRGTTGRVINSNSGYRGKGGNNRNRDYNGRRRRN